VGLRIRDVQLATSIYYGLTVEELIGNDKKRRLSRPRMVAMFLARKLTDKSLPQIGAAFNRDHTTVIHAARNIPTYVQRYEGLQKDIDTIEHALLQLGEQNAACI